MGIQATFDLGEARQKGLDFPVALWEKYQPRIQDFVGLSEVKKVMRGLLRRPRPVNLLFVGEPGTGKTVMAMKLAEQLPAAYHHIRAQSCDVDTLDRIWERCQYIPAVGDWHLVHVDEADGMTDKAQLQLLSRMDGTACLRPVFGGGFERGEPPRIIYVFTCNGRYEQGRLKPPQQLLPRFVSRCIVLNFEAVPLRDAAEYLAAIWRKEKGPRGIPIEYFEQLASGVGMRDALNRVDTALLSPPTPKQIKQMLEEGTPDGVCVHEDEHNWRGFLCAPDAAGMTDLLRPARLARGKTMPEIVEEAKNDARTLVTADAKFLEYMSVTRPDNTTRCGGCSWGVVIVGDKRDLRRAEIAQGVKVSGRFVPWRAAGLANLCVTVSASGRVRINSLTRCQYCEEQYPLPWQLEEETSGKWNAA